MSGKPPRRRGPLEGDPCLLAEFRLTFASAGTTGGKACSGTLGSTHPRVGRDHCATDTFGLAAGGSPPRRRGALALAPAPGGRVRFTPASAGTTLVRRWLRPSRSVHPRLGGDHDSPLMMAPEEVGSPPRRRGPRRSSPDGIQEPRFTPASAGTTGPTRTAPSGTAAHPRVGGDHSGYLAVRRGVAGSPPRRPGPRLLRVAGDVVQRFTPASAGTTTR